MLGHTGVTAHCSGPALAIRWMNCMSEFGQTAAFARTIMANAIPPRLHAIVSTRRYFT